MFLCGVLRGAQEPSFRPFRHCFSTLSSSAPIIIKGPLGRPRHTQSDFILPICGNSPLFLSPPPASFAGSSFSSFSSSLFGPRPTSKGLRRQLPSTRRHPERPRGAPGRTGLSSLLPPPDQPPLSRLRDGDVRREADQRVPEHLPGHPEGQEVPLRHLQDRRRGDLPGQGEKDHHMRIMRHTISPRDLFISLCLAPYENSPTFLRWKNW